MSHTRRSSLLARAVVAVALALCAAAPPASAGDPIMPLSEVREGMHCEGRSVIRGTEISSFNVEVIDVVEDEAQPTENASLILVRVSGPAVDATGIGPGFSGSPVYCEGRNAGAISATVGEYGHKLALATPIEQVLGESPDPPRGRTRDPALLRSARSLAGPLTVAGLSPRALALLQRATRRTGRTVIGAPPAPLRAFPPQDLQPGASVATSYSTGDVAAGAVGTVAYRDGDNVWGFGHPLDSVGARSLLLQDAYVYTVVSNPNFEETQGTYKLAAPGHTLGELRNDAPYAVTGRLGPPPPTTVLRSTTVDTDADRSGGVTVEFPDEGDVDTPLGASPLTLIAPIAIAQSVPAQLRGSPARSSGTFCLRINIRERRAPLRFCNRYVANGPADIFGLGGVADRIGVDALQAFGMIEDYRFDQLRVESVSAMARVRRGLAQEFIVGAQAPRSVRRGRRARILLVVRRVRGGSRVVRFSFRVPRSAARGVRRLSLIGTADDDAIDFSEELGEELNPEDPGADPQRTGGDPGARSVDELARQVASIRRFDGVRAKLPGARSVEAYRDPAMRISGRVDLRVRVR